ncbi:MAG: hypothetical protein ACK5LO_08835 [Leucobacter sp.]
MTNEPDSTVEHQISEFPSLDTFSAPPEARIGQVQLDLVYASWGQSSLGPPSALEWGNVQRGDPVRIETTHTPVTVHLRVTDSITDSGLPDVEQQRVWECEPPSGQPCNLRQTDGAVLLEIDETNDPDIDARYAILQVEWFALDEEQAALRLSASYAFDRGPARGD